MEIILIGFAATSFLLMFAMLIGGMVAVLLDYKDQIERHERAIKHLEGVLK